MRYVPVVHLQEQMILGQDIYDASGRMLLAKSTALTPENISYIAYLGVPGIYIDDEFSADIQVKEVIRPEIKQTALSLVKNIFLSDEDNKVSDEEKEIMQSVSDVVDDIINEEQVMTNLVNVKTYDDYTYFHSVNVAVLGGILAAKCHLPRTAVEEVVTAGFLHDIGKVAIDINLLNAPRQLPEAERTKMMDHPRIGYETLINRFNFNDNVNLAVYQHHEWYNGGGYPCHIDSRRTTIAGRILKCADVYDAMTSKRIYHNPYLPSEVMEYIMGRSGMEFDPFVVQIMATDFCVYPSGCEVELSDGRKAIVVENHKGFILRPSVRVIETGEVLDLIDDPANRTITIVKINM